MFAWPNLELTDYERKYVSYYKTATKPGVLRRTYKVVLNSPAQPTKNLPIITLSGKVQISRRARVFGLTFTGNTDSWRLQIVNASGTQYTNKTPRSNKDPMVSSMLPGTFTNAESLGGLTPPLAIGAISDGIGPAISPSQNVIGGTFASAPLIIDPNWLLTPNQSLFFNGTPIPVAVINGDDETSVPTLTLNISVHVWEFPGMDGVDA